MEWLAGARTRSTRGREDKRSTLQLADHPVHVPQAIAEHRPVRRLAKRSDVPLWIAQQSRRVEQTASRRTAALLGVLAPLTGEVNSLRQLEASRGDRRLDVLRMNTRSARDRLVH